MIAVNNPNLSEEDNLLVDRIRAKTLLQFAEDKLDGIPERSGKLTKPLPYYEGYAKDWARGCAEARWKSHGQDD